MAIPGGRKRLRPCRPKLLSRGGAQRTAGTTNIEIVAVNDLTDINTLAHLLKYDSVLGLLPHEVSVDGEDIVVGDQSIKAWSVADGPARSLGEISAWTS